MRGRMSTLALVVVACMLGVPAAAGAVWITPGWPAGAEPRFEPVPLYWFTVRECPLVYRCEVQIPVGANRATAAIRTGGYVYVYVDGEVVYGWAPRRVDSRRGIAPVPADRKKVHVVDLTGRLTPGRHVLAVSAPAGGFVLDGELYQGVKRVAGIATGKAWTVTKFRPTTILPDEAALKTGYTGPAGPVAAGQAWRVGEDALAVGHFDAMVRKMTRRIADVRWRAELAGSKGIIIRRDAAYGWGGSLRLTPAMRKAAAHVLEEAGHAEGMLAKVGAAKVRDAASLAPAIKWIEQSAAMLRGIEADLAKVSEAAYRADAAKARLLAARVVLPKEPSASVERIEKQLGHPINDLNESRYDRLGWFNHPQLSDSDVGRWGVRINPAVGPTSVRLNHRWRFRTDAGDTGLAELRHTVGYNIANQWPWLDGQQSWTKNESFKDYKGLAWYRQVVHLPAEWAGNTVVLELRLAGEGRIWLNDREITKLGGRGAAGTFTIPAHGVVFGGQNCLVVRVGATGDRRGLMGATVISCPSLDGPAAKNTPQVDVLATPLSPCVVLQPRTRRLNFHHAGTAKIAIAKGAGPMAWAGGKTVTAADHALLWLAPSTPAGVDRPILLVFQKRGATIRCVSGVTEITLAGPAQRVIAVRPWARAVPKADLPALSKAVAFWRRAARAVPVNYMSVTRVARRGESIKAISIDNVPRGPRLAQTVIYDYLVTDSDSPLKPLKLAPLPALCSFAADCKFPTLKLDQAGKLTVLQDGGLLAPHRGLVGADRVSYSYNVEPYPRFAGFTSWMFSHVDVGVRGNTREMELIASTGANSYRPQHNWSNEMPPKAHVGPGDKRTRVQIMLDACQTVGVNYMNNIDQTLGPREGVRGDYDNWVKTRLFPHFDRLVPQLAPSPFAAVAIDLINEPFDHKAPAYNRTIRELTQRVRKLDRRHLLYVEPCQSWGAIRNIALVQPTGDPLTGYSFHDYNFRLHKATDRWPTLEQDRVNINRAWLPAIEYGLRHGVMLHCGEFGGFAGPTNNSLAQKLLLNDFLRIFDQFGMHHHYYSGRSIFPRLADGSCGLSNVVRTYREYFKRPDFNAIYRPRKAP